MCRVDELACHMHLDQLFLLPAHQRQGVGETLVRGILEAAKRKRIPVLLWVLRVKPARRLCERMGFTVIDETPASLHLERRSHAHEKGDTRDQS
jgi:GNAT superfamily N-acetyltransferase